VDAICRALKARFNKDIEAETATDTSLIGGFKIQVGNTIYDNCISTRLETFRQQLIKA
jgi:F0F1-type ATP synthase delta subunit